MKNILILFALLGTVLIVNAQSDQEVVEKRIDELYQAMIDANKETLLAYTSPALTYGHSSGTIESQDDYIDAIMSGKSDYHQLDVVNQTIKIVDNVALVRHTADFHVNDFTIKLGVLLVWKKEKKNWKLIARQAFRTE